MHLRSGNRFGRYGSEGLSLLLPQSDGKAAKTLAETLRELIGATPSPSAGIVSASSGVALGLEQEALLAWLLGACAREDEGVDAPQQRGCNGGGVAPGPGASSRGLRCTSIGVP